MNYEKKYKDALANAREEYNTTENVERKQWLEELFPELKESEDERIRKAILNYLTKMWGNSQDDVCGVHVEDAIAWLEKQGQVKESTISHEENDRIRKAISQCVEDMRGQFEKLYSVHHKDAIAWLEKQAEQKPTDKVKPKFKVGDWITDGYLYNKITDVLEDRYIVDTKFAKRSSIPFKFENYYHLWTIQDAKEGDVLAYVTDEEDLWIMIYWSLYEPYEGHVHYHALLVNDKFSDKGTCCISINDLKPATKEQRDLLFQKMHEAGYEWDEEKKEPKKIEKKSAEWSEKDEERIEQICDDLKCGLENFRSGKNVKGLHFEEIIKSNIDWLKSLKGRVQPKHEWSKEDIYTIENIDSVLFYDKDLPEDTCVRLRNWLKSLKDRYSWKPSDEQLEALKNAIHLKPFENPSDSLLWGLYERLKKLK